MVIAALSLLADEATTCLTERSATRLQQLIDTKGLVEALQKQQRQRWQSGRSKKQTAKGTGSYKYDDDFLLFHLG